MLEGEKRQNAINDLETERREEAKVILIEHNLRIVWMIASKFKNVDAEMEDLFSVGSLGLIKAVDTFNSNKNAKLETYASRCIENEILMYLRRGRTKKNSFVTVSIDAAFSVDENGNELAWLDILSADEYDVSRNIESKAERRVLLELLDRLDEREKMIIKLRFGFDDIDRLMSQKEVGEMFGISQSYAARLEKAALKQLKAKLLQAGF